jgi:Putative abortive phage resistance protein AbiGi, antitoxin
MVREMFFTGTPDRYSILARIAMALPRARTLFHFTRELDALKKILLHGFWPRFCREEYEWLVGSPFSVLFPMVCFCDIPLSRTHDHTRFYGSFGLGMTKEWGKRNGLNPVAYVRDGSSFWTGFRELYQLQLSAQSDSLSQALTRLLAFAKPFEGSVRDRTTGAPTPREFYQECEWRYVLNSADAPAVKTDDAANDRLTTQGNRQSQKHMLMFDSKDIRYLLVDSENSKGLLVAFLTNEPAIPFSPQERTQLTTRIVVWSSLQEDI